MRQNHDRADFGLALCRVNQPVELHVAYRWDCPFCATKNYTDLIVPDLTPEEHHQACVELGQIEAWEDATGIEVTNCPAFVMCSGCNQRFPAYEMVDDEDDADEEDAGGLGCL